MALNLSSGNDITALGVGIDPRPAEEGAKRVNDALDSMGDQAEKTSDDTRKAQDNQRRSGDKLADDTKRQSDTISASYAAAASAAKRAAAVVAAAFGAANIFRATEAHEGLIRTLEFTTGSAEAAATEIRFLREEADRLGIVMAEHTQTYADAQASFRNTALEGQGARDVFIALSEAASVLHLSQERTGRAFTALSQIAGKQVLTMEELQGQLAEAIPGALDIMQRALGLTGVELREMVEARAIDATEAISAFARQLREDLAPAIAGGSTSASASFARLNNQINEFAVALGQSGLVSGVAWMADRLTELIDLSLKAARAVGILRENIAELSVQELGVRHAEGLQRILKLNQQIEELEAKREARERAGPTLLGGDSESALENEIQRRRDAIARIETDLKAYGEAIRDVEKAEKDLAETERLLGEAIIASNSARAAGLSDQRERIALTEDEAVAVAMLAQEAADEAAAWGNFVQEGRRAEDDRVRTSLDNLDRMREAYVSFGDDVSATITRTFTTTGAQIEGIVTNSLGVLGRGVARIQQAGGSGALATLLGTQISGTTIGGALQGISTGGVIGAQYAGLPGLVGGALGGGLGRLGGGAVGTALQPAITAGLGTTFASAFTAVAPIIGTAIGAVLGSVLGGILGRDRAETPELYFIQRRPEQTPYSTPYARTPFGNLQTYALDENDAQITSEVWENIQGIVNALALLDESLAQAFGPDRTEDIRQALEGLHIGADIDEIDIPGLIRRRTEIIFAAVSDELVDAFSSITESATISEMAEAAALIGNIFQSLERGNQIFADVGTVIDTLVTLAEEFQREGESLAQTFERVLAGMILVNELRDENQETTTSFAQYAQLFVDSLGGMEEALIKTDRFMMIFSQTASGMEIALRDASAAAEEAFSEIDLEFNADAPRSLDEFNRSFLEVQNSLDAADLAAWVEAGLALADFIAIFEQMPQIVEDVADGVIGAIRDVEAVTALLAPIRQRASERGLSDYEIQVQRFEQSLSDTLHQLQLVGASEQELAFAREEGALVLAEMAAAEQARLQDIADAREAALQREYEEQLEARARYSAQQEAHLEREYQRMLDHLEELEQLRIEAEEAERERVRDIQQLFQGIDNQIARETMSDLEYQVRMLNQAYAGQVRELMRLGGSEDQLRHLRALYHEQLDMLIVAEGERNEALREQQRQAEQARLESIRQELLALEQLGQGITDTVGGLIERITSDISTPEENYERLRDQAEALAGGLQFLTDPAQIEASIQQIEHLAGRAWGLFAPDSARGEQFIEFLESVEAIAQERLAGISQETALGAAGTLNEAANTIDAAFDEFLKDAVNFRGGVDEFVVAVNDLRDNSVRQRQWLEEQRNQPARVLLVDPGMGGYVNA